MTDADLGRAGEDRLCDWLNLHPLVDRAFVNPNSMHGFADIGLAKIDKTIYAVQVKTKVSHCPSPPRPYPCGRTGRRFPARPREHGFETARLERYQAAGASVVIVERDGPMLVLPMDDPGLAAVGIRYGCHTDCPKYRAHPPQDRCDFFFYVDRDILFERLCLPDEPDLSTLEKLRLDFKSFTVANAPQSYR
jgi:hypothetical protein